MKTRSTTLLVGIAAMAVALSGWAVATAQSTARRGPTTVAVVDMQEVFSKLKERQQLRAELQSRADEIALEVQERQKSLKTKREDLALLSPGSPDYQRVQNDIEAAAIEIRVWAEVEDAKLKKEQARVTERMYRDVIDELGELAKEQRVEMVMFKEPPIDFDNASMDQIVTIISVRKVLWSDDRLDMTESLIQRMNNRYANRVN